MLNWPIVSSNYLGWSIAEIDALLTENQIPGKIMIADDCFLTLYLDINVYLEWFILNKLAKYCLFYRYEPLIRDNVKSM